jgi:uncharacterized protein (TIGR02646 family)
VREFNRMNPPAVWAENEARWNGQWVELLARNRAASFSWYRHEGRTTHDIALPTLKAQTGEHCSFCDGFPIEGISLDTIEHFRPKCHGRFPERAYTWGNLYYCCSCCQKEKREKWDENLIAPDAPGHTFNRYFEFDFTTGELRASTNADDADRRRAQTTIDMYGLDTPKRRLLRKLALKKWTESDRHTRALDEHAYRDYLGPSADLKRRYRPQYSLVQCG